VDDPQEHLARKVNVFGALVSMCNVILQSQTAEVKLAATGQSVFHTLQTWPIFSCRETINREEHARLQDRPEVIQGVVANHGLVGQRVGMSWLNPLCCSGLTIQFPQVTLPASMVVMEQGLQVTPVQQLSQQTQLRSVICALAL
jgi:hypothetical protein